MAASRPTGDRSTSTSVTQPNSAGWSFGETPNPAQSRNVATPLSMTTCAASAASSTGHALSSGTVVPAAASTATGPTECHASATAARRGSDGARGVGTPAGVPSTIPAATKSGTDPSGRRKSIGTSTTCVGIVKP